MRDLEIPPRVTRLYGTTEDALDVLEKKRIAFIHIIVAARWNFADVPILQSAKRHGYLALDFRPGVSHEFEGYVACVASR